MYAGSFGGCDKRTLNRKAAINSIRCKRGKY